MRKATWVPAEMTAYNVAKFGVLAALGGGSALAVMESWIAPALVAVLPVTFLLFTRVLPSSEPPLPGSDGRAFRKFLAGESTAMVLEQIGTSLLPVLVVVMVGPRTGAPFGLAWMMTSALDALVVGMAYSLIVEGSQPGADVRAMYGALRRRCLLLLAVIVVVSEAGAPILLKVFGGQYASDATTVFRLLVLASVPRAVTVLAMSAARAERRIGWVVRAHLALAVLVPGLTVVLCRQIGLDGAGIAWAGAQSMVALGALVSEARWRSRAPLITPPEPAADGEATMVLSWRPAGFAPTVLPASTTLLDADLTMVIPRLALVRSLPRQHERPRHLEKQTGRRTDERSNLVAEETQVIPRAGAHRRSR
jgi:hypothetical protein